MREIKMGEVRYVGDDSRYIGNYKVVYENGVSVALEDEDLLIYGFDRDVFMRDFTYSE